MEDNLHVEQRKFSNRLAFKNFKETIKWTKLLAILGFVGSD